MATKILQAIFANVHLYVTQVCVTRTLYFWQHDNVIDSL